MYYKKINKTPAEESEEENLRASIEKQKEKIEQQTVLIQYLAEMSDIYIPNEEEAQDDVQYFA